jgi:hypothetical protein
MPPSCNRSRSEPSPARRSRSNAIGTPSPNTAAASEECRSGEPSRTGSAARLAAPAAPRLAGRWLRRLAVVLVVGGCLWLFRAPLLTAAAGLLVVDQPIEAAEYVVVLDEWTQGREALRVFQAAGASRLLLLRDRPCRLHQCQLLAPEGDVLRGELSRSGLSPRLLRVLTCQEKGRSAQLRLLSEVLAEEPRARVIVLCDRFRSRCCYQLCRALLPRDQAERIRMHAVIDPLYDEQDWWRHKEGVLNFFDGVLGYTYFLIHGAEIKNEPGWDPDRYEEELP